VKQELTAQVDDGRAWYLCRNLPKAKLTMPILTGLDDMS